MAQIDTGLGWSAEGNYLHNGAGVVFAQFSTGMGFDGITDQPIPRCSSDAETVSNGYLLYTLQSNSHQIYVSANTNHDILVFRDGRQFYMLSTSYDAEMRVVEYYNGSYYNTSIVQPTMDEQGYPYNGFLYVAVGFYPGPALPNWTLSTAISKIVAGTQTVTKLNPGFAVCCVVNWKDTVQTRWTPILISTDENAVDQSLDGTTVYYNQYKSIQLLDGVTFYMSIIRDIDGYPNPSIAPEIDISSVLATVKDVFRGVSGPSYANIIILNSPDPYEDETEPSEEEGGGGESAEDDPVDEETMPIPAVVGLGFSTIYVPTQTDLSNLAAYLWGGNLDLDNFLRLFANPMDSILGLSAVPLVLPGTPSPIYLGGQILQGITMPKYTGRTAVKVDMGTVTISERWGSYLDYDPYTELSIYLPFVGIKNIKADDVMKKTIHLMYDIDILSGACIAYLRPEGGSVLYEWSGQCAMQIPITGANWDNIFNSAIHTAATLGGALFAPASAPVLGGAVASAASQAIAAKPRIERSGAMNGVTGFLGQLRPYIIRTIPEAYIPNNQNKFIGYPSYVSVNLGSLTGYNEIASIHLENIPATGDELTELESILKGGAIF